ncbi:MAG: tetratricopeptide repeat protein [Candidatus Edwardsbacteria bacterium]|nr:tetratricopeptide repeat protein [Candidatus Edwardsbacteria bacterium]MBU1575943.1 tetratricopeptide repeat protein [Candidatus Edwardsbacteria bacterium]MBU2463523.1 tetratricopeptide repeat protein [Candidatus Edwardsbacteria bacterium]MBU2595158.1 tetratricopeptide repeat protein [Candidatus Edwardsbacteria bacterium]
MRRQLLIFTALLLMAGLGYSQEDSLETAPAASGPIVVADTADWANLMQWQEWRQRSLDYQHQGMPEEALAAAESSLIRSRALGLDLPVIGAYWGNKTRQALKNKDWEGAQKYSRLALLADNYSFKNNISHFQANSRIIGVASALGQFIQAINGYRQDFRYRYRTLWLGIFGLSLALIAGGLFFLLLLTVKYLPYLFHLLSDLLPKNWPYFGRMFLATSVGVGLLVIIAGFSLALAIMIPAGAVIVMGRTREKVMFWITMALIGCSAAGFNLVHQFFKASDQGRVEALAVANTSEWNNWLVQDLAGQQQQDPSDLKPIYALSLMEKNRGRLDRAQTYLTAIIEASGNNPSALNNLGNIYFFKGQFDSAASFYRLAIEADQDLAEAHYNLGQVHFKAIDFNQARVELERAASLAPARMESRSRKSGGNMVMDAQLDQELLWPEVWRGWKPLASFAPAEAASLTRLNLWLPLWAWLVLVALIIVWMVLVKDNLAVRNCWLCGRYVCARCQALAQDGNLYCQECHNQIFSIQSQELQQKAAEVLSRQAVKRERTISGLANFFLPGSSFVMRGSAIKGWLLSLSLGLLYAGLMLFISPWISPRLDFSVTDNFYWIAGIIMAVLYLISWVGYIQLFRNQGASDAA